MYFNLKIKLINNKYVVLRHDEELASFYCTVFGKRMARKLAQVYVEAYSAGYDKADDLNAQDNAGEDL
jgi:hypothetical protein